MESITQKDNLGCSVACVAFVCKKSYYFTKKKYFTNLGEANKTGFLCKDIVTALKKAGKNYDYRYIKRNKKYKKSSIVFIKRSKKYPEGHFLTYTGKNWMDPWINFNIKNPEVKKAKAGFRKKLPGKAIYEIFPMK